MTKKILLIAFSIAVLLAPAFAAAPVGVGHLNGTYDFQVIGVKNTYGYFNNSGGIVSTNGGCPKNVQCQNIAYESIAIGTINFDGKGHAKFLGFSGINQGGGGPKVGVAYPYSLGPAGLVGSLTITGPQGGTVSLSPANFNAAGIATTILLFIPDHNPSTGTAVLQ